jgi:hypothetical protein
MNLLSKKDLHDLLKQAGVKNYRIFAHGFGPFPLHYAVLGGASK